MREDWIKKNGCLKWKRNINKKVCALAHTRAERDAVRQWLPAIFDCLCAECASTAECIKEDKIKASECKRESFVYTHSLLACMDNE